ncbi:MAG: right-handed parallel beta-helix repeat-containing protein [Planctomycetota bacterium]|jgi:hypothetical protein
MASPVSGDVLHVSAGGQGASDIQSAINAAMDGDTVLVAAGVYAGPLNFGGKAVTVEGDGATLLGTGGPVVVCDSGEGPDTRLIGFTITGGSAPFGGGMFIERRSSPTVIDCTFEGNAADAGGGGMYVGKKSSPTVTDCTFAGNAAATGGGLYIEKQSNPTVIGCTFEGNAAEAGGGGMYVGKVSSPTVTDCTFSGNAAGGGGGMYIEKVSSPYVTGCVFAGNTAVGDGGGVASQRASAPQFMNCVFAGNSAAGVGGALFSARGSNPVVTNCTFSGNDAGETGGSLACFFESSPIITNCVLWGNTSGTGAVVHADGESAPWISYSCVEGGWTGTGNVEADPRFVDALGSDGLAGTGDEDLRLGADSPCIDAGDNTAVPPDVVTDLGGNPRFVDAVNHPDVGNPDGVNPIVDMGAFEGAVGAQASPEAWVLWHHRVGGDYSLWMMNGGSVLAGSGPLEISPGPAWQVAGLGDFDGDGNAYDILWRHELIGNNSIWFMDGRSLRPDSGRIQHLDDLDWAVAATGDFDGDGKSDIMWRHAVTGRNSLWLMDGRTLLPGSGPLPTVTHPAWTVVGAGDFNGDGMCDVLWRHGIIGRNTMWLMDGTVKLPGSGALPEVNDPEWRIVGTGDFDGDAKCDILWRNGVTGRNTMWLMDGKTRQRSSGSIQEIPQREWKVMGTVDFDGDGMSDIFWRNTLNGKNSLWLMDGRQLREGTASIQPLPDPDWTVVGTAD